MLAHYTVAYSSVEYRACFAHLDSYTYQSPISRSLQRQDQCLGVLPYIENYDARLVILSSFRLHGCAVGLFGTTKNDVDRFILFEKIREVNSKVNALFTRPFEFVRSRFWAEPRDGLMEWTLICLFTFALWMAFVERIVKLYLVNKLKLIAVPSLPRVKIRMSRAKKKSCHSKRGR